MNPSNDTNHVAGESSGAATERDEKGRFRKGNAGGPGNPFARRSAMLRKVAMEAVSEDDITEMFAALKRKAKEGDVAAIKLLLAYTVGKPGDAVNPDTLDRDEIVAMAQNHATSPETMTQILEGLPADVLLVVLRAVLPILQPRKVQMAQEYFRPTVGEEEADEVEQAPPVDVSEVPDWMRELAATEEAPAQTEPRERKVDVGLLASLLARMTGMGSQKPAAPIANRENRQPAAPLANRENRHNVTSPHVP